MNFGIDMPPRPAVLDEVVAPPSPAGDPVGSLLAEDDGQGSMVEGRIGRIREMLGIGSEEDWAHLRLDSPGSPEEVGLDLFV